MKEINAACKVPNLFILMQEKNISISKLSNDLGISTGNISDWKSGRATPKADKLLSIAEYLETTCEYLLGKTENRTNIIETVHDNHGVIGDTHAPVTINNGLAPELKLGDIEKELLSICRKLDMKRKNALLAKAYEILEEK